MVAAVFTVFLLMGMPVAFAIGISGALFFLRHPELPVTIPVQVAGTERRILPFSRCRSSSLPATFWTIPGSPSGFFSSPRC